MGQREKPMSIGKELSLYRTLSVTAEMLRERNGQNMSIAEIARRARCSTATIYDAFASKEELFYEALRQDEDMSRVPVVELPGDDGQALDVLVGYLIRRVEFLSDPRNKGRFISTLMQGARGHDLNRDRGHRRNQVEPLALLVEAAMRAGLVREGNPRNIAYCLSSTSGFEPFVMSIAQDERIEVADVVFQALEPFVTDGPRASLLQLIQTQLDGVIRVDRDERSSTRSWLNRSAEKPD